MALTDKNLYAYCDNDPVTRVDADGEFWLISVGVGLATQYVGDVIGNIIDGKTGIDIIKRTSSIGEYIAAGVTALIPGSGLGSAIVRSVVTEGIKSIEETIQGKDDSAVESLINIGLGTAIDWGGWKSIR